MEPHRRGNVSVSCNVSPGPNPEENRRTTMQSMNPGRRIAAAAMMMLVLALPALAAGGQVNLNTATVEQLQLLPRVGPSLAQRIVEYRDRNDGFQVVEDLLLVRGVGEAS